MSHPYVGSLDDLTGISRAPGPAVLGLSKPRSSISISGIERPFGASLELTDRPGACTILANASPTTESLYGDLSVSGAPLRGSVPHTALPTATTTPATLCHTGEEARMQQQQPQPPQQPSHVPMRTTPLQPGLQMPMQQVPMSQSGMHPPMYDATRVEPFTMSGTPPDMTSLPNPLGALTASMLAARSAGSGTPPQGQPFMVPQLAPLGGGPASNASHSSAPSRSSVSVPMGCSPQVYNTDGPFLYSNYVNEMVSLTPPQSAHVHPDSATTVGLATPTALPMMPGNSMHNNNSIPINNASASLSQTTAAPAAIPGVAMPAPQVADADVRSNLFICGLPMTLTDRELVELFEPHGAIESAKVMLDIHTGRSRGIAFVKFREVEHAENAVDALNGTTVDGHQLTVRVANSRAAYLPGNPTNKTFVRNVPLNVSRAALFEYFAKFGEVTDLSIKADTAQGRHHGPTRPPNIMGEVEVDERLNIVFITYSTKEAAAKAAEATHTKMPFPECNGVPLLAKVAEDTTRRMERLSRRQRPNGGGGDGREMSTANSTGNSMSMGMFAMPTMGAQLPPGMMMPSMLPMPGAYPTGTFVTVPNMGSLPDLSASSMVQSTMLGGQLTAFRDANGNTIYAPAPSAASATAAVPGGAMPYPMPSPMGQSNMFFAPPPQQPAASSMPTAPPPPPVQSPAQAQPQQLYISTPNGFVPAPPQQVQAQQAAPPPPPHPQQPQQPQPQPAPTQQPSQAQPMYAPQVQPPALASGQAPAMPMANTGAAPYMYVPAPDGTMVPVMYGGAPPQAMNPYFMMMGGNQQPPGH